MGKTTIALIVAVLSLALASTASASAVPQPKPMCTIDEFGNCLPSCDWYNDPVCSLDTSLSVDESDFYTYDSGNVDYNAYAYSRCSWAGVERKRHAPLGRLWTMYLQMYWCWNGSKVTSYYVVGPWGHNDLDGTFAGNFYSTSWSITTPTQPYNYRDAVLVFTQMEFQTCFVLRPFCAPAIHPTEQITVDATGHAQCWTDTDYVGNCKGVRFR